MTNTAISKRSSIMTDDLKENEVICSYCNKKRESDVEYDVYGERIKHKTCDECKKKKAAEQKELRLQQLYRLFDRDIPSKLIKAVTSVQCMRPDLLNSENSLFLHGGVGVGKTILALQIARSLISKEVLPKFLPVLHFTLTMQNAVKKDIDTDILLREIASEAVLVIDDLGSEKMTDFVRQNLLFVIDYRDNHELQTIITSNLTLAQIEGQLGSRICSRLAGMCNIINIKGKDRRIK